MPTPTLDVFCYYSKVATTIPEVFNSKLNPLKRSLQRQSPKTFVKTLEVFFNEMSTILLDSENLKSAGDGHIEALKAQLKEIESMHDPIQ
jgi:hypothetical protein